MGLANLITGEVAQLIVSVFPELEFSGADSRFLLATHAYPFIHSAKLFEPASSWNTAYYGVKTLGSRLGLP